MIRVRDIDEPPVANRPSATNTATNSDASAKRKQPGNRRAADPDAYREYMRALMRKRRALAAQGRPMAGVPDAEATSLAQKGGEP
jgi:hypothetical protein